ncbi:MAG: hypothetical protein ACYC6N_29835 [Pirellulaceae bacterium]
MSNRIEPPKCALSRADFEAIVSAANQGSSEALDRLREVLDDNPDLYWMTTRTCGNRSPIWAGTASCCSST